MSVFLRKKHAPSPASLKQTGRKVSQSSQNWDWSARISRALGDSRQRASTACVCHKHQLCDPEGQTPPARWSLMCSWQAMALHPDGKNNQNSYSRKIMTAKTKCFPLHDKSDEQQLNLPEIWTVLFFHPGPLESYDLCSREDSVNEANEKRKTGLQVIVD